jgi:hypothetical protein
MSDFRNAVAKIKKVGVENTRISPEINGKCILEIKEDGEWTTILKPMKKTMLEDVISQASNKVILG